MSSSASASANREVDVSVGAGAQVVAHPATKSHPPATATSESKAHTVTENKPRPATPENKTEAGLGYWVWTAIGFALAWVARDTKWYTPGSMGGYYLGVVGGISMLTLLLYPMRKRIRILHRLFPLKYWFRGHMFLGVFGPILIIFHSKLHLGSTNAAIAFYCMLAVFISGLMGRFVYVKIHHGLYGRRGSRAELKQLLGINTQEMRSRLHFARDAEAMLLEFEEKTLAPHTPFAAAMQFFFLPIRKAWVQLRTMAVFNRALLPEAKKRSWDSARLHRAQRQGRMIIGAFLNAVQSEAQFTIYERLFSLWHVLHVPLVFLLVITGIIHVIAVHMY